MQNRQQTTYELGGKTGELLHNVTNMWLLPILETNPSILEMFRDRNVLPYRLILPWSGEFAGKYLTGAVQVYRLTKDPNLKAFIEDFVEKLMQFQAADGYLGPRPDGYYFTGSSPNSYLDFTEVHDYTWDSWEEYHIMLGLLLWYETSLDQRVLTCVKKIGDLFYRQFVQEDRKLVETGSSYANFAPLHSLCKLYQLTHEKRYLHMAEKIVGEFSEPGGGDYLRNALRGGEFYECAQPRWESLHVVQGLASLYEITGDPMYKQAFEQIWFSIAKTDVHNTGGFSSDEQASGNPFKGGSIETCCTVAWMALSADMLRISGNPVVADMLERSMYNAAWGAMHPSGRWFTYSTPMEGYRIPFYAEANWQAKPGSPELNCCSATGAKVLGILCDWALMTEEDTIVLNYYGLGTIHTQTPSGKALHIRQTTEYPRKGEVNIQLIMDEPDQFALKLRIPGWSRNTRIRINGEAEQQVESGYILLSRQWRPNDEIRLELDMSLYYMSGEQEQEGRYSIYRGPILLAYDDGLNTVSSTDQTPHLDGLHMEAEEGKTDVFCKPWMLISYTDVHGRKVNLCDFFSAGLGGRRYATWLKMDHVGKADFSDENPLRVAVLNKSILPKN